MIIRRKSQGCTRTYRRFSTVCRCLMIRLRCGRMVDKSRLNLWGGSIAYGHPFAATGGRMLINVLHLLQHTDGTHGIVTACAAGGLGAAMVVERAA